MPPVARPDVTAPRLAPHGVRTGPGVGRLGGMTSNEHEPTADSEGAEEVSGQEPAKKHGDPLFNEAEGEHGPADVPEVGEGTATSASAG